MTNKLYIGSLSYDTTEDSLKDFFSKAGTVSSASIIIDKFSGRSKGFGFVEMSNEDEAKKAIEELNGKELDGRSIVVDEAKPMEKKPFRDGDNRGGGGGGGYNDKRY
jgi:RNA recognition motif-containing protein